MDKVAVVGGGCACCACCIVLIILLSTSISKVDQTEWCLKYSWWTESVDSEPIITPGVKFIGPGKSLIRYPNTNKYCYFRDFSSGMSRNEGDVYRSPVAVRTQDGLNVELELEFVYKLMSNNLYDLYMLVGDQGWTNTMVHLSEGVIDNWATTFTAHQFYGNRTLVANKFQTELTKTLREKMFIEVKSLMLQPAHFPQAYSNSIKQTQEVRQDIEVAEQERTTKLIQKQTQINTAVELKQRAVTNAEAEAERIRVDNDAEVSQYTYRQQKEAEGYQAALQFFVDAGSQAPKTDFLNYLKVRALNLHNQSKQAVQLTAVTA